MATAFKSVIKTNIGLTSSTVFTPTSKSVIIGLIATNVYGSVLPITIKLNKSGGTSAHIAKARRIEAGQYIDFIAGNKLILEIGDTISASSSDNSAFEIIVSYLEGVS